MLQSKLDRRRLTRQRTSAGRCHATCWPFPALAYLVDLLLVQMPSLSCLRYHLLQPLLFRNDSSPLPKSNSHKSLKVTLSSVVSYNGSSTTHIRTLKGGNGTSSCMEGKINYSTRRTQPQMNAEERKESRGSCRGPTRRMRRTLGSRQWRR